MRFAAAVTLFHPTDCHVTNLTAYADSFDLLFIYDNTPDNSSYIRKLPTGLNVFYTQSGHNNGLPRAFNTVLDSEYLVDCDYLCMLDQDSEFDRADIQTMKTNIKHCMRNKVGLHAPMICYRGSQADRGLGEEPREWVIASGSFLNLRIVRQFLLRFDENYFIDKFEVDFCKQLRLKGCEIILYRNCMLRQKLGYPGKYVSSNHNPVRHYYLFRNRLYFNQKFHSGLVRMGLDILQSGRHLASIIIREDCKIQKLRMCMKGYGDYLRGSLGCVESVPGDVESGQV